MKPYYLLLDVIRNHRVAWERIIGSHRGTVKLMFKHGYQTAMLHTNSLLGSSPTHSGPEVDIPRRKIGEDQEQHGLTVFPST